MEFKQDDFIRVRNFEDKVFWALRADFFDKKNEEIVINMSGVNTSQPIEIIEEAISSSAPEPIIEEKKEEPEIKKDPKTLQIEELQKLINKLKTEE